VTHIDPDEGPTLTDAELEVCPPVIRADIYDDLRILALIDAEDITVAFVVLILRTGGPAGQPDSV